MLIVPQLSSVEIFTVLILAQDFVELMPIAKLPTIYHYVSVIKDTLEIHLLPVEDHHHQLNQLRLWIHATQIHVDPTVSLQEQLVKDVNATVCQRCWDLLPIAGQNVKSMLTVPQTKHVSTGNARTHVLDCVESMLTVELEIIFPFVSVTRVTLEIHSPVVTSNQVRKVFVKRIFLNFMLLGTVLPVIVEPCNPSPCGINAVCTAQGDRASCTCIRDYTGNPYIECKPECVVNAECPRHLACVNQHCVDPCPGVCGYHATCHVTNHLAQCTCDPGYTGDAFIGCTRITTRKSIGTFQKDGISNLNLLPAPAPTEVIDPCNPSPCGQNAICTARQRAGACRCIPEYFGDPYVACRPECTINADCPSSLACVSLHCVDPCPGVCGVNAQCRVVNHAPTCTCNPGYRGDPFTACSLIPQSKSVCSLLQLYKVLQLKVNTFLFSKIHSYSHA